MANKKALVLSGGGVKGAFQVGVLEKLIKDMGSDYDILTGVSVGALNSSLLGRAELGIDPLKAEYQKLRELWDGVTQNGDIYRNWFFLPVIGHIWGLLVKDSLYNSKPLQKLIKKEINGATFHRDLFIGSVKYGTGEYVIADKNTPEMYKYVIASSAYPGFLTPVEIQKDLHFDGGLRRTTPINSAIEGGADELDVVLTAPRDLTPKDPVNNLIGLNINGASVGLRGLEILIHEAFIRDLKLAKLYNDILDHNPNYQNKRKIKINVYAPTDVLTNHPLKFQKKEIQQMIEKGTQCEVKTLDQFLNRE